MADTPVFGFAFDLTGAPPALYVALGQLFEEVGLKRLQASLFTGPFENCVQAFRRLQKAEPDLARWASSFVLVKVEHDLTPALEQTRGL